MKKMRVINLFSGSSGNCTYVECCGTELLIDAGGSAKKIGAALNEIGTSPDRIRGIFITHEHSDHVSALRVLEKNYQIPVFLSSRSAQRIKDVGEIDRNRLYLYDGDFGVKIGGVSVRGFRVPHDSVCCYGYIMEGEGHRAGIVTDIGEANRDVEENLCGCDLLVIEANHDESMVKNGPYPSDLKQRILSGKGHLSNENCGLLAAKLERYGLKRLLLAHLSEENNTAEAALETVRGHLGNGVKVMTSSKEEARVLFDA